MDSRPLNRQRPPSNIVLTGFMGTGKSVAGHIVARETGREFVDTDKLIVALADKPIADIFFDNGEATFRRYERTITRELAGRRNLVIATGGRLMLDPLNALLLSQHGLVFCLTANAADILSRTEADLSSRPLIDGDDPAERIATLLRERQAGYSQYIQVNTSGKSVQEVASRMIELSNQLTDADSWRARLTSHIPVRHPTGTYDVLVGRGLLSSLPDVANVKGPTAVVTDSNVAQHYVNSLGSLNRFATIITPAGEKNKNLDTIRGIYDQLLQSGIDRQGTIVTLGGGVVGDMGGFAAATYMRGIDLVHCPTSLLAMVDASVGGKTGVDLPQGKNLVGSFKQPKAVIADLDTLRTLPGRELIAGMAEVVKGSIISSPDLLDTLEDIGQSIARAALDNDGLLPFAELQTIIVEAVLIKREIVELDPFEQDQRRLLNLGHTFAHAIEKASNYSVRHGEAVSIGLHASAVLSAKLGYCAPEIPGRLKGILVQLELPVHIPGQLPTRQLLEAMTTDKKVESGELRFVLIRDIGSVFVENHVPESAVVEVLDGLRVTDQ
ncbi:MAG TPA: 3-dehydroquinate synthase [candidate division Zixibacteria bacterium]|nr:3-dehydroquinate synthase [candidate division Zixibacteria bacterium]